MASKIPSKLLEGDTELVESKSIASALNNFFASVGNKIAASVPDSNTSPHSYLPERLSKSFYFPPLSMKEIEEEISKLSCLKATGTYSIPSNMLITLQSLISKP